MNENEKKENDYKNALKKLAPQGDLWPTDENSDPKKESNWMKLLRVLGKALARIDNKARELLNEAFPDTTSNMLPDWERVAGLPDHCTPPNQTVNDRRKFLLAKLTDTGGQTKKYFEDLAEFLEYDVEIRENFDAFRTGRNSMHQPLNGRPWEFTWQVKAPQVHVTYFHVGRERTGEPLSKFDDGNKVLMCAFNAKKPAHTHVTFAQVLEK